MSAVTSATIDVDKIDLDHATTKVTESHGVIMVGVGFGWLSDLTFHATDPDKLDRLAEEMLTAAIALRAMAMPVAALGSLIEGDDTSRAMAALKARRAVA